MIQLMLGLIVGGAVTAVGVALAGAIGTRIEYDRTAMERAECERNYARRQDDVRPDREY